MIRSHRLLSSLLLPLVLLASSGGAGRRAVPVANAADSSTANPAMLPHLVLPPSPVAATDDFVWNVRVRVVNPLDRGIFLDSLGLDVTDLYPGSRRFGQTRSFHVSEITDILRALSPNDSGFMTYSGPSYSERARVTMRIYCHTGDGRSITTADASVEMSPAPVSLRFPPIILNTKKGKVEYTYVPEVWPGRPSAAVLLIHGEDAQSRDWLPMAWSLANHGFACMLMSLPGYGFAAGPPDFAGPHSIEIANFMLDRLRRTSYVDSNRVSVWGISEGATVAALVGAKRKDLAAVVLQSALYDLPEAARLTQSDELRHLLEAEAGPKTGWKARSPLLLKAVPGAPTLILHGEADHVVPATQAQAYAALFPAKARVALRLFPDQGHLLPIVAARDSVLAFLKNRLPPPPPRSAP